MTLVEIMVASTLGGLVLLLFFWLLVPTLDYTARGTTRAEVQQQAVMALNAIESALRRSALGGISTVPKSMAGPNPVGLSMIPLKDVDDLGRQMWELQILSFWWDQTDQRLRAKTWPPRTPAGFSVLPQTFRPVTLSKDDFNSLVGTTNGSERFLASGVVDFDVVHAGAGLHIVPPLTLKVTLEREVAHQREAFTYERTVSLRNSL